MLCEASNELQREPSERVRLDELIKIHIKKLWGYAQVNTEVETVREIDHAVFVLWVPLAELLQDIDFNESLLMKSRLDSNEFDRGQAASFGVNTPNNLSEAPLPKDVDNFVSVCEMIAHDN